MILKKVENWPFTFGGVQHSGWLPPNAATPKPTPVEHVFLNVSIERVDGGYLLVWSDARADDAGDPESQQNGDTWHQTIADAESAAADAFGITSEEWRDCSTST